MVFVILSMMFIFLMFAPQMWVRYVMRKHSRELEGMPGTGGELGSVPK